MKTFLQIFFLAAVFFFNNKILSQNDTILCQQWVLDSVHEFAVNDIYNCTDKGSFSIREIEFEGVKYIQIYGYYGTFGVAYNYKGKIFTLDGDLIHAFDSDVNDGNCNPCNDIPYTQSTDLYNCDQIYPSCSDCSTEIVMVRLANNCGLAPKIVSTGEILRVCGIQAGLTTLPGEGRRAKIGYNLVNCGPSVCNFAEKQIEVICIDGYDDVQLEIPSKLVTFKDNFDIPLIVKNFKDVQSFQFPVTWDSTKVKLVKVHSLNARIPNFTLASNFNTNPSGQLRCLYSAFDGPLNLNINDTLFFLQLKTLSEICDTTSIFIPKAIQNNNNTEFNLEITKVFNNVITTVNVKTKDSKLDLNKTLCNSCSTAIEMVQGTECILPQVISTGEILYPCEYTNGVSELPSVLGFKTNIGYKPYEGTGCTSFCQQGTPVSIGCVESSDTCGTHPDYAPLMALYNSTNGPGWANNTGWVDGASGNNCDPCNGWYGVTCDSARVSTLHLSNNNLMGVLPLEFDELAKLKSLVLDNNNISGTIPSEIGLLLNLENLALFDLNLQGEIPTTFSNLMTLKYLSLNGNQLSGQIPEYLGRLSNLENIYLFNNLFDGSIPPSIGDLTKVKNLWLQNNNLNGCLPENLSNLCPIANLVFLENNPMLLTQSWTNFCASQEGKCTSSNIEDANEDSPFYVFPNPTYDRIYVSKSDKLSQLEVMSIDGKSIFTKLFLGHEINVSSLLPGVYILKLRDKDENLHILKFVKRNL